MTTVLSNMGRAFLKAFVASLIVVLIGLSSQHAIGGALGLGIAGLMASIAAGLAAITTFIPFLSFESYIGHTYGVLVDSFLRAFLAAFVTALAGWLAEPNYAAWHAALIGIVVGALNAGLRALQAAGTKGESPLPVRGVEAPPTPVAPVQT